MARRRQLSGGGTNAALITGARDIAQAKVKGDQQMYDSLDDWQKPFDTIYKMGQAEKASAKSAKDAQDKQMADFMGNYDKAQEKITGYDVLNEVQTNSLYSWTSNKRDQYAEIGAQLEDKTLSPEERNKLKFKANEILVSIRNFANNLNDRKANLTITSEELNKEGGGNFSYSNIHTDPGRMSDISDQLIHGDLNINDNGSINGNLGYNRKATKEAKFQEKQFQKISANVSKEIGEIDTNLQYGEKFYGDQTKKFRNALDDQEALSFMFDDLRINDGGYYDALEEQYENDGSQEAQEALNTLNMHVKNIGKDASSEDRKAAMDYFKDTVAQELTNGLKTVVSSATQKHNAKILAEKKTDSSSSSSSSSSSTGKETELSAKDKRINFATEKVNTAITSAIEKVAPLTQGATEGGQRKTIGRSNNDPVYVKEVISNLDFDQFRTKEKKIVFYNDKYFIVNSDQNGKFPVDSELGDKIKVSGAADELITSSLASLVNQLVSHFEGSFVNIQPIFE